MVRALRSETIEAPTAWACALVNGDYSSLDSDECAALRKWRKKLPSDASIVSVEDGQRFTRQFDLYGGTSPCGEVSVYTYLTKGSGDE